ncbi:MAG: hypothetical protein KAJ19_09310, partial [Gammaproteobacteria bacterium]|nr:hypothetical protein [Gammaproteobacteria bacterium]
KQSIDKVLSFIRANVDASATVSRKTGEVLIHYAVENGQFHNGNKPFKSFNTMNVPQVLTLCDDMDWTHSNTLK